MKRLLFVVLSAALALTSIAQQKGSMPTAATADDFSYLAPPEIPSDIREMRVPPPPVVLGFTAGADGRPQHITILRSSKNAEVDASGKSWLANCRTKKPLAGRSFYAAFGFKGGLNY